MDLLNVDESPTRTYPILSGAAEQSSLLALPLPLDGSGGSGASSGGDGCENLSDLDLGLDLGSIAWDLCDFTGITYHNSSQQPHTSFHENQSTSSLKTCNRGAGSHSHDNDRRAVEETDSATTRLDELDFELSHDIWMALNGSDNSLNTTSPQSWSPINSPSAEQTYSNLASIETSTVEMPSTTAMSSSMLNSGVGDDDDDESTLTNDYYPSSVESASSPQSTTVEKSAGQMRRTRARTIDKKESNKVAAIKYRNKKMLERQTLFAECEEFVKRNAELKKKIDDTQTEISFIKSLLVEVLIAKNKSS